MLRILSFRSKAKQLAMAAACTFLFSANTNADLLWSDNFNVADDANIDGSDLTGRLAGLAAGEASLQVFGNADQNILNNQLDLGANGGVRFNGEFSRYDWAGATTGASIISGGGFVVEYDWFHEGVTSEWLAWKVGTSNSDTGVNGAAVDHALLPRQGVNGAGEENERWDNGTNLGYSGISYGPVPGVLTLYKVRLTYTFSSFADGSAVNLLANINGVDIVNDNFTWDGNGGALHMELNTGINGNFVDNLSISSLNAIPEPGSMGLIGLVALVASYRRRRA